MKHVVFVDSTPTGLLALRSAKALGCFVTFIKPVRLSAYSLIPVDPFKKTGGPEFVDRFIEIGDLQGDELHEVLQKLHAEHPIDALITTSEAAIVAVARESELLGTLYPSYEALTNAVFKNRCREVLRDAGVRSVDFEVLTEAEVIASGPKRIQLPFVVKPIRGFAKQFSAICKTQQDYDDFASDVRAARERANPTLDVLVSNEYIVEEYIDGTLHSAETIVREGKTYCYATTIRFRSYYSEMLEMTATMPSGLNQEERDEMGRYVQEVFTALKLDVGLYHVELLRDAKGPVLVEINARMMGSVAPQMYRMISGICPFEQLIRLHLGEPIVIDDSHIKGAASVVTVAARYPSKVSAGYDAAKLVELLAKYKIDFSTLALFPGRALDKYEGNLSTIGHVIVQHDDPIEAARAGHRFLCELEELVGFELAKYFDPATF